MEELSKKLADHDQASKVQQQKLKVGRMGVGRCSKPLGVVGVQAQRTLGARPPPEGDLPVTHSCAFLEL